MENYDLELESLSQEISKNKYKKICLQLPDGLKPKAETIIDFLKKENPKAEFLIWFGTCYGACDIPQNLNGFGVDLLVQFGHNKFVKTNSWK